MQFPLFGSRTGPQRGSQVRVVLLSVVVALLLIGMLPVQAAPTTQDALTIDLYSAAQQGLVSYEARGRGVASGAMIELTVSNQSPQPLNITIPAGTRFIPVEEAALLPQADTYGLVRLDYAPAMTKHTALLNPGAQGGIASGGGFGGRQVIALASMSHADRGPSGLRAHPALQGSPTQTVLVEAYCSDAHEDNPSAATRFRVEPPGDDDLTRLVQTYEDRGEPISTLAAQIAVWILTDDVDMDFLREVGYEPDDAQLREALLLIQEAGIDISDTNLGQMDIPPAPPEEPDFQPGQTTAVRVRGTVTSSDQAALASAYVVITITGPQHSDLRLDVTTERGRFDTIVNVYEDDTITLSVIGRQGEIGRITYSGQELYDTFANGGELVITLYRIGTTPTPTPELPTPTPEPDEPAPGGDDGLPPVADAVPLSPVQYGTRTNQPAANIRQEPTTGVAAIGRLDCGARVVTLIAQAERPDGTWYQLQSGGWMRFDTLRTFASEAEAETARQNANCVIPPTAAPPTQPPPPQDTGGGDTGGGQTGGDTGGGGGQSDPTTAPPTAVPPTSPPMHSVTIVNNASCTISGALGPAGYSVGAGQSTSVSVPTGNHQFTGSGDCGSVSPSNYNIDGPATITIG
jgi:hypothetical protein